MRESHAEWLPGFDKKFAELTHAMVSDLEKCLQCGKCTAQCPAAKLSSYNPRRIIRDLRTGNVEKVISSKELWLCFFCGGCYAVLTGLQFERLISSTGPTGGHLKRPSDGKTPKRIVFVQCVGSRDPSKGHAYCSGICCMYTAKHATLFKHHVPDGEAYVCYIDIRSPGKGYDEFVRRAIEEYGVRYLRGRVARIRRLPTGQYRVFTEDAQVGRPVTIDADMVVLASAVQIPVLLDAPLRFVDGAGPVVRYGPPLALHVPGSPLLPACRHTALAALPEPRAAPRNVFGVLAGICHNRNQGRGMCRLRGSARTQASTR